MSSLGLAEERLDKLRDVGDLHHLDSGSGHLKRGERGNEYPLESEAGSLTDPPVKLRDWADLSAEADLTGEAAIRRNREIEVGGQHGTDHGKVAGRLGDPESAGHVQEHVLLGKLEAGPAFEHGEKHVESPDIKTCRRPLRSAIDGGADQSLNLEEERTGTIQHGGDRRSAEPGLMHRDKQLGWIGDLAEPLPGHLEDSQLGSGSESVLYAPENPVRPAVVTFELKDDIDDVLKDLRTGDVALLRNVADEDHRNPRGLGEPEKDRSDFLYLGD